jgi:hypothetical protein
VSNIDWTQAIRSNPNFGPENFGVPGQSGYINWAGPTAAAPGGTIYGFDAPGATSQSSTDVPGFADYINTHTGSGDAWAYLQSLLADYGLGDLDQFAQHAIVQGLSTNEIVQQLRTTDTYKKRFAVIEQRKQLGLPAVSEAEVIQYEKSATQMMRAAGLPSGFWDSPEDFVKLQVNDISLSELQSRVNDGYLAAAMAPQDLRDQWKALGYTEGDLAAYMLDPDRTEAVLTKQIGAVQRAAEAQRVGFGQLSTQEAEQLQALGVTSDQAQQGFADLINNKELLTALPGEQGSGMTREQQFQMTFQNNAQLQQQLKKKASERAAIFAQGGGFASNQQGFAGIGTAR